VNKNARNGGDINENYLCVASLKYDHKIKKIIFVRPF